MKKCLHCCLATPTSREAFGRDVYDPDVELFHPTHEWQTVKQGEVMKDFVHGPKNHNDTIDSKYYTYFGAKF